MAHEKVEDITVMVTEQDSEHPSSQPAAVPAHGPWPTTPQPLTSKPWVERGHDLYDAALCLIPVALIVEAILCVVAAHRDSQWTGLWVDGVSNLTIQLIRFNGQLTTAFTIVFVLIFTTFLKRYALWRVQTGETIARLEQYQASASLPSTFKAIISLRSYNAVSCALVFAWSFYYVGSQASKEQYKYSTSEPYGKHGKLGVAYQSDAAESAFEPSVFPTTPASNISNISKSFNQRCLPYLGYLEGSDFNGNAILPWLDSGNSEWQDFRVQENVFYSSYAGILLEAQPFWDPLSDDGEDSSTLIGNFHYNSSYLELDCTAPELAHILDFPTGVLKENNYTINMTLIEESGIYFTVWQRYNETAVSARCEIWTQPVEVKGHCDGSSCQVSWGRPLPYDWQLEVFKNSGFASNFFEQLVLSQTSWLELYTNWVALPYYVNYGGSLFSSATTVDTFGESEWWEYFSNRLQQSLNTWYYASQLIENPVYWTDNWISDQQMYNIIIGKEESNTFKRSTFEGAVYEPAYRLNVGWVIADLISNTVLLAAAIASFWLRKHTLAPDILTYVSSLTRDNPNVPLPDGGSALSGWDRARMLRDVRVRIADKGSDDGVGRVTLAHADAPPTEMRGLDKSVLYV